MGNSYNFLRKTPGFIVGAVVVGLLGLDAGPAGAAGFLGRIFGVCTKCEQKTEKIKVKIPVVVPNPKPPPETTIVFIEEERELTYWIYKADPVGVTGFNLDFQFDTSLYDFLGFTSDPGIQLDPSVLDLTDVSLGLVQSIAGVALSEPVTGDMVSVILTPKTSSEMMGGQFLINTEGTNFINYIDTDGISQTYNTAGTFAPCPVPGPLPLLGVGAAFGYSRKLRKRIKSSKPEVISTIG